MTDNPSRKQLDKEVELKLDNLKLKLDKAEININNIIELYDMLSKGELSLEDKYIFSYHLINLYNKADRIANIKETFHVEDLVLDYTLGLMKSSDLHEIVIGIDNFMAFSHMTSLLIVDLVALDIGVPYIHNDGYNLNEEEMDIFYRWRSFVSDKIKNKLDEIRNRAGLKRISHLPIEEMLGRYKKST